MRTADVLIGKLAPGFMWWLGTATIKTPKACPCKTFPAAVDKRQIRGFKPASRSSSSASWLVLVIYRRTLSKASLFDEYNNSSLFEGDLNHLEDVYS